MECSMALSAVIPARRFFLPRALRYEAIPKKSCCACAASIQQYNAGASDDNGSNPQRYSMFSDRARDLGPQQGQEFHPDDGFRSAGSRSVASRPSIPGRYSKYSKNEPFRKISSPTKRPPRPILPPASRGYSSSSQPSESSSQGLDASPSPPPAPSLQFPEGSNLPNWSRKHLEQASSARRVRPPPLPREHLELPVPKYPNRLQQGFATRWIRSEPAEERPVYELPFEFQYTYSEMPKEEPIAERGPQFSPFGPDTMPRPWTGRKPLPPSKKKRHEIDSFNPPPPNLKGVKPVEPAGPFLEGQRPILATTREEVMGEPLTPDEIGDLVLACNKEHRQVNIGRDGLTHNMLDLIHCHWKRRRVIKLRCKGVPTIDMDNVCFHIEDKTGGKIIQRHGGSIYLFRGRNYNPRYRPEIPLMMWKPPVPIYPRLIQQAPAGLSVEHADYLRRRGRRVKPLTKLSRNGVYLHLVNEVKSAFEVDELVKLDCRGMNIADVRKIGAKLKELLGIVLLSFEDNCVLMWRGPAKLTEGEQATQDFIRQSVFEGKENSDASEEPNQVDPALLQAAKELENLWERAINFGMVTTLEDNQLDPDTVKSLCGAPPPVKRVPRPEDEEDEPKVFEVEDRNKRREELLLQKRLAEPLPPPEPSVGVLPVDELAKLLASPR
ncbi:CRS2-associated factor 2, chloroplastic [Selaginella moellendorffii]|uniref:CRS2-associated factor 2, chloroplastic n=1 Tax=Selaginella moellendorffii TaxID=88036 RepID=UPI000D1C7DA3|nr:CRS2-associated factor 2, chloroplastic [Selaginella moellendorffii]|eukprot:XP_024516167.1 CRS2-associated factor 2, chloroplastic [Selaginella moellendorffii]